MVLSGSSGNIEISQSPVPCNTTRDFALRRTRRKGVRYLTLRVRCYGEAFASDIKQRLREGNVVCVTGRLRLNPQLEPQCNKYFYFPYIHVAPPHGSVAVVHGDRRKPPPMAVLRS